ncbi:WSC domain-containing protein [Halenospora varia]|nr:WSC domain-containing protein [Halenospora varia]
MKLHTSILVCTAVFFGGGRAAIPTWPAPIDELEDVMYLNTGYKSRGLSSHITPCSYSEFGAGRQTAAEWLRIGFHDMATTDIFFAPHGGIDGSIAFELQNGENVGTGFQTSLNIYSNFLNSRVSIADMIALGVYSSVRGCGGPAIPMRGGRVDATKAGKTGVPQPQNGRGTFINQFARMGFNAVDMIQMVACGHTMGGVHAAEFPNIVPPRTAPNDFQLFDTTPEFDNNIVVQYVNGPISDPLTVGPSVANTRNSDFQVFTADAPNTNSTVKAMQAPATFNSVCSSILQRMIETVDPDTTTLSDVIQPYEVKPSGLQLTLLAGGTQIKFLGDIRVRTTTRSASQIASVLLIYKDRIGGSTCGSCSITTTVAGTANGFDDSFSFYSFDANLPSTSSISSFTVLITLISGGTETYNNNGGGFLIQDSVIVQTPQSCVSNGNLTILAAVRSTVTTPVSMNVTQKVARSSGTPVPALVPQSIPLVKGSAIGPYDIYSASYAISSTTGTKYGVASGTFSDDFKDVSALGSVCAPLSSSVPSSTSTSTTASQTSTSSSTSISSSAIPSPTLSHKSTIGAFTYIGCYTEGNGARALTGKSTYDYPTMTLEKCAAACTGFTYWGVEYGGECYCGNTLDSTSTLASSSDCSFICPGNQYEYCGAGNRLEMYKLSGQVPTSSSSSVSSTSKPSSTSSTSSTLSSSSSSSVSSISSSSSSSTSKPTSSSSSITTPSTTSTSATATPTLHIVPSALGYTYYGCYTEASGTRALNSASSASDSMTIEQCIASCSGGGYKYAGAEYGRECWCGDSFGRGSSLVADGDCSMTCAGDKYSYCGAGNRLGVYVRGGSTAPTSTSQQTTSSSSSFPTSKPQSSTIRSSASSSSSTLSTLTTSTSTSTSSTPTPTAPVPKPTIGPFTYLGCRTEGTSSRALTGAASYDYNGMTLEICASLCSGWKYFGVEYGGECYCGNEFNTGAVPAPEGERGCSFTCPGDKWELCGAGNRLTSYVNLSIP